MRHSGPDAERSGGVRIRNPFRDVGHKGLDMISVEEWIPDSRSALRAVRLPE